MKIDREEREKQLWQAQVEKAWLVGCWWCLPVVLVGGCVGAGVGEGTKGYISIYGHHVKR